MAAPQPPRPPTSVGAWQQKQRASGPPLRQIVHFFYNLTVSAEEAQAVPEFPADAFGPVRLILVHGCQGAGKSRLCRRLHTALPDSRLLPVPPYAAMPMPPDPYAPAAAAAGRRSDTIDARLGLDHGGSQPGHANNVQLMIMLRRLLDLELALAEAGPADGPLISDSSVLWDTYVAGAAATEADPLGAHGLNLLFSELIYPRLCQLVQPQHILIVHLSTQADTCMRRLQEADTWADGGGRTDERQRQWLFAQHQRLEGLLGAQEDGRPGDLPGASWLRQHGFRLTTVCGDMDWRANAADWSQQIDQILRAGAL